MSITTSALSRLVRATAGCAILALAGCAAYDRAAGTDTSGIYPAQREGTRNNPPGNPVTRAFDRTAGTDVSGAYPSQKDGTRSNPPGTAATRAYDRATGDNVSGAYPNHEQ